MKAKAVLTSLLLLLSFLASIPIVPTHAAISVVQNATASTCGSGVSNFGSAVTVGNYLIVGIVVWYTSGTITFTVTDTVGNSFSVAKQDAGFPNLIGSIYYAKITTGGSDQVTVTESGGVSCHYLGVGFFEVSGLAASSVLGSTSTGHGSGSTAPAVASMSFASDSFIIDANAGDGGHTQTVGGCSDPKFFVFYYLSSCAGLSTVAGVEYTPSTSMASSPNTFTWTTDSGDFSDAAAEFQAVTVVVVVPGVGPCNFFELQCWWYPLLFMGLYSGYVLWIGTVLRTSSRGKAHLFLSAVTFGSLIAVIFGIMNIVFPLLMLVLNTVIALRLRG